MQGWRPHTRGATHTRQAEQEEGQEGEQEEEDHTVARPGARAGAAAWLQLRL